MNKDTYIGFDANENLDAAERFKSICSELKSLCLSFPTCSGCPEVRKHKGCIFRGKTPREIEL